MYGLVIPLIVNGDQSVRAGLAHDNSLGIIASMFKLYGDRIHGNVAL